MMPQPEQPQLRPAPQVQWAHAMLVGVLLDEKMRTQLGDLTSAINCMASVLCWVLHHDHNGAFGETLDTIEGWLAREGIAMVDGGGLKYPGVQ